jgi:phosphate transport system protein
MSHENEIETVTDALEPLASNDIGLDDDLAKVRRRMIREAAQAIDIIKFAINALWDRDESSAMQISKIEKEIDKEEVRIEQECYRILALKNPFAADFRLIAFILRVNSDIERVADHASSINKIMSRLDDQSVQWPESLREMGERIPVMCEQLLRAVVNTDAELARSVVKQDRAIDKLDSQAFDEISDLIEEDPENASNYMLIYRIARELERVGDLLGNIAEGIIYLVTGNIVRHTPRKKKKPSAT